MGKSRRIRGGQAVQAARAADIPVGVGSPGFCFTPTRVFIDAQTDRDGARTERALYADGVARRKGKASRMVQPDYRMHELRAICARP